MNADLPNDIVPGEPGLDRLVDLLTCSPTPDELTGESAALAMFRARRELPATVLRRRGSGRQAGHSRRLAAAVAVALIGVFAAAAYTEALPAPVQHVAYRVLGFVGVPDVHHPGPASGLRHPAGPATTHSTSPSAGSSGRSTAHASPPASSPAPRPSPSSSAAAQVPPSLSVTVARGRIPAGAGGVFTGHLTDQGHAIQGAKLSLLERPAGQPAWHLAGDATTGSDGRAVLAVEDLTTNTVFRLTGPNGAWSQPVLVIVVPPVSISVAAGPRGRADVLTVSCPLAVPGDVVVLQAWSGAGWLTVRVHRLDSGDQAAFLVRPHLTGRVYRAVLPATAAHGRSVSHPVRVRSG